MRIDSHQHFWHYHPVKDAWITDDMKVIQRDFLPADLAPNLRDNNLHGCVAVQAGQSETETHFLLELARANDFIKGVVGWVDLQHTEIGQRLEYFASFPALKGFRHIVQAEAAGFMLDANFQRGIRALREFNFTYDILIHHHQLAEATTLVRKFPDQFFAIDHLAKPAIAKGEFSNWKKDIVALAECPNVYCKISGMVTEAHWTDWKPEDFAPYMDTVASVFGAGRIMFGSDWPVCLLAASYSQVTAIADGFVQKFSNDEQEKFWGQNAIQFYNL
jgi:L-fuconolactonase